MSRAPTALDALLEWYLLAGVDETVGEIPIDRYVRQPAAVGESHESSAAAMPCPAPVLPAARTAPPAMPSQPSQSPAVVTSPGALTSPGVVTTGVGKPAGLTTDSVESAVTLVQTAASLDQLRDILAGFDGCSLRKTATNLVFGNGNPRARVVLIGEAPGAEEDRQGVPFVGPSGKLLDRMLASIGLDRTNVFISNTVFWRPPGNRPPTSSEVAVCLPFVERLIELVDPGLLITLGGPASTTLLGQSESVSRLRGRWFSFQTPRLSHPIAATAIFHPAYLLRSPAQKRLAWRDLLVIKHRLHMTHLG